MGRLVDPRLADRAWFVDTLREHAGSRTQMARSLGIAQTTVSVWRGKHEVKEQELKRPPLVPISDEQLTIEGDAGVSSDWHAPIINYEAHSRFLEDCHKRGLTQGVVAGDLTNQDALAGHEDKHDDANLSVEIQHLTYAVSSAMDVFDTLYVSLGNHDRHAARDLKVSFDQSLRMLLHDLPAEKLARIVVTSRDSIIVNTERGPWLVCHTRSYSRLPLAYPNRLALRHGMHVAAGHRHHHAIGKAPNGKDAVELGGLFDETRMPYTRRYTNDLPAMANGYGVLQSGWMHTPMLSS